MKPLEVLYQAEAEADAAFEWYWEHSETAAIGFSAELREAFFAIRKNPHIYPEYAFGTRRRLLNHYPFFVVFRELLHVIQVIAVVHAKRRERYWKDRI
jgi:plasmid stabilization system protein ParE